MACIPPGLTQAGGSTVRTSAVKRTGGQILHAAVNTLTLADRLSAANSSDWYDAQGQALQGLHALLCGSLR